MDFSHISDDADVLADRIQVRMFVPRKQKILHFFANYFAQKNWGKKKPFRLSMLLLLVLVDFRSLVLTKKIANFRKIRICAACELRASFR